MYHPMSLFSLLEENLLFPTECLTTVDSMQQCNQRAYAFYHINSSSNNVIVIRSPYSNVCCVKDVCTPYRSRTDMTGHETKISRVVGGARWLLTSCRCINRFRIRRGGGMDEETGGVFLASREGWIRGTGWRTARTPGPSRWTESPITSLSPDSLASRSSLAELAEVWFAPALAPHAPPPAPAAFPRFRVRFPHFALVGHGTRDEAPRGFGR